MTVPNINDVFPAEIFVNHIFKHLDYNDLQSAMLTCSQWKKYVEAIYDQERNKCKFSKKVIRKSITKQLLKVIFCNKQYVNQFNCTSSSS